MTDSRPHRSILWGRLLYIRISLRSAAGCQFSQSESPAACSGGAPVSPADFVMELQPAGGAARASPPAAATNNKICQKAGKNLFLLIEISEQVVYTKIGINFGLIF